MTFTTANEYAFVNARIRGMKSRLLTIGDYERLLQSGDYENFMKVLMATSYGPVISAAYSQGVPHPDDLALILSKHFAEISHNLTRSLTGRVRDFAESYMDMFLAESIKSIIRGIHVGLDPDEILRFSVPTSEEQANLFSRLIEAGSVERLIDTLPYPDIKLALLTRLPAYDRFDSTAPLEVALEEWFLRSIMQVMGEFSADDQKRVLSILETRVVLRNVLTVLRAILLRLSSEILDVSLIRFTTTTNLITESIRSRTNWREVFSRLEATKYADIAGRLARIYGDEQNLADVELAIEDHIAQRVKQQLVAYPFHLGVVLGFFNLKFYEIRNIRSIAVGIERGESAEIIRRMITLY